MIPLHSIGIIHEPKNGSDPQKTVLPEIPFSSFCLETCQRRILVTTDSYLKGFSNLRNFPELDFFHGAQAYGFLLRVTAGLESAVVGETDIFGQVKESWKRFESTSSPLVRDLQPWVQKLFEDTKEIRSRYLHNLGGASYGSLVRLFLRPEPDQKILLVGAGKLAQSVAPYLADRELWILNRNLERAEKLKAELKADLKKTLSCQDKVWVIHQDEQALAWENADFIVLCVPVLSPDLAMLADGLPNRVILHLGCLKHEAGNWGDIPNFYSLSDLFDLQKVQGDIRSLQISRAKKACRERALLRSMGHSLSIAHGWEDLAAFALEAV